MTERHAPSRRELLLASGVLFAWAHLPKAARAEGRDPRFLVIVLRGALDGLATVAPVGDPDWRKLRGDKALTVDGPNAALELDGFFALNPAMPNVHRLYRAGQAAFVHAAATSYRERSHFDGQDVLESGLERPGTADTGWLNRALAALEPAGRAERKQREAFAVGPVTPLVVRGPAPVLSWTPPRLPPASDDTVQRLADLYRHTDPALARVLEERMGLAAIARAGGMETHAPGTPPAAGAALLGALDGALAAIETGMGAAWSETAVAVITEFGRTARINGTDGTDHGTATLALLAGGAVKGRRVVADWPGLGDANLYEGRDLQPTIDLRAVLKGLLKDHLRLDEEALASRVFPGSRLARPMPGLIASA